MGMAENVALCKYCGAKAKSSLVCAECYKKLPLVRKLVSMCEDFKERVEQERIQEILQERIQNDLERVRGDG